MGAGAGLDPRVRVYKPFTRGFSTRCHPYLAARQDRGLPSPRAAVQRVSEGLPSQMQTPSRRDKTTEEPEHEHINNLKRDLESDSCPSGVVVNLFEFTDDNNKGKFKLGRILHTTSKGGINFEAGKGAQKGSIKIKEPSFSIDARFQISDTTEQRKMEDMVSRGLRLRHAAILKPLSCVSSGQLLKVVSGFTFFNQTLVDWISGTQGRNVTRGLYLEKHEKYMVSSAWGALMEIWNKGYTSDSFNDPLSYVMVGDKIKILPSAIRLKNHQDSLMVLRNGFANLLQNHISPLWANQEFDMLIHLIRDPEASSNDILGHPVLSTPARRLVLYRSNDRMSNGQKQILNARVNVNPQWQTIAQNDPALNSIISKNSFLLSTAGAAHFCNVASSHYSQHVKQLFPGSYYRIQLDAVDKLLMGCLPLLLCNHYALKCRADYKKAAFV